MALLHDGFLILLKFSLQVGIFYLTSIGLGLLWLNRLRASSDLSFLTKCSLALILGLIPLSLFSYLFIQLAIVWPLAFILGSFLLTAVGLISSFWNIRKLDLVNASGRNWLTGGAILVGFFLYLSLRMAYLKEIILPPYTDSVAHYQIVKSLIEPKLTAPFFSTPFYHLGFHSITAWFSEITGLLPEYTISLVGQMTLSLFPVSLFALVYILKNDWKSALLTSLVGAFFWTMPAHAVDWGKFPTLCALVLLPAAIGLFILITSIGKDKHKISQLLINSAILIIGILFIHSRMLICFMIFLGCYYLNRWVNQRIFRAFDLAISFSSLAILAALIFTNKELANLYSIPLGSLIVLASFSLASAWFHPRMTTVVAFCGILMFVLMYIPIPMALTRYSSTWMDMPFLKIFYSLTFTLLVGSGLNSVMDWVTHYRFGKYPAWVVVICLVFWMGIHQSYLPDKSCNYVTSSDTSMFTWIKSNLPQDALIAIPGRLDVMPEYGTDAGIWITSMTGRSTFLLPYYYAWTLPKSHEKLCSKGVVYIFVSSHDLSFQGDLATSPEWYQPISNIERTAIYRVIGCSAK